MENRYYVIDYNDHDFFIRELIPNKNFLFFVRETSFPEIELLADITWGEIDIYYGAMLYHVNINKEQKILIRDLNIIKGYYINIEEAKDDLEKLTNFIKSIEEKEIQEDNDLNKKKNISYYF